MTKLIKNFQKKDVIFLIFILGLVVGQVICDLTLPEYMNQIITLIQQGASVAEIWNVGWKMILLAFATVMCSILIGYFSAVLAANFSRNLRQKIFKKVNSFSMEEMNKFSTPSLITRSTNDVSQVQGTVVMFCRLALSAPIMAICALIKIIEKSSVISWVTAVAILLVVVLITIMTIFVIPKFKIIQNKTDRLNGVTRENLTGIRVVRANNAENLQQKKFEKVNADLTKNNLFVNRMSAILTPGMNLIMNGLSIAVVWLGAYMIEAGTINLGDVSEYVQYSMMVVMNFLMLTMLFTILPRAMVSIRRINDVLSTKNAITDGNFDMSTGSAIKGSVVFKNVGFKYPSSEAYVLKDISFEAKVGETIAFVGSTGCGKSTLINLIPRFYDATEGEILIDGVDIKEYKIKDLNNKIGYVPQRSTLFSGTISENVKYGNKHATEEQVMHALEVAQASSFVKKLDGGLQYDIAQGGKNVSGGQKQRLQIARAIVKKPEIFIFDDSFSALDYKTDRVLRKKLKQETNDVTTFIVAQRIGTIMDADKIIVLEKGEIVGVGTHKELLNKCAVYKEIALSQLSKEELV